MATIHHITGILALSLALTTSLPGYAFSLSDLFGGSKEKEEPAVTQTVASPLTDLLSGQLGVSPEQAAGGAGALLSMASNSLSGEQASELAKVIPGMDGLTGAIPGGMGSMLSNMDAVNQVFSLLGMDSAMVMQFAPLLLQFIGNNGASAGLLSSLGSIWQTG